MRGARRGAIAAGKVTSAAILQATANMPRAAAMQAQASLLQAGGYNPADREYWPGGGVVPVGLTNPAILTDWASSYTISGFTGTISNRRFTNAVTITGSSNVTFNNCWWDLGANSEAVYINITARGTDQNSQAKFYDCKFSSPQFGGAANSTSGYSNTAVVFGGVYFYRCEFSGFLKAWSPWANTLANTGGLPPGGVMDGCWIHSMSNGGAMPWESAGHREAIHWEYGGDFQIRNCWIEFAFEGTATLSGGDTGHANILIENNVIGGEAPFVIQPGGLTNGNSNCIFRNNRIASRVPLKAGSLSQYGRTHKSGGGLGVYQTAYTRDWQFSGNVWHNTDGFGRVAGQPANLGDPLTQDFQGPASAFEP